MSNPAKFALSYLLIDVYLTGHFPQLFITYNPGPPDLHDISQASVYKGLKLSLNFTCNQPIQISLAGSNQGGMEGHIE
jgi:hypothetical protein